MGDGGAPITSAPFFSRGGSVTTTAPHFWPLQILKPTDVHVEIISLHRVVAARKREKGGVCD